jgi:recombination protein RecT
MTTPTATKGKSTTSLGPVQALSNLLFSHKDQLKMVAPRTMTVDKIIRVALTSFQKNPTLMQCEPVTIAGCVMQSTQLGLLMDGVLGEAYMVPYKNNSKGRYEAQFQVGYKGLRKLVNNSGPIDTFMPQAVYEGDWFDYDLSKAIIKKHQRTTETQYKTLTHVYTIVKYKSGTVENMVMSIDEALAVRDHYSQAYRTAVKFKRDDTPWIQHQEAMCLKTVMRKHAKYLPLAGDAALAGALDERADAGLPQDLGMLVSSKETSTIETTAVADEKPVPEPKPKDKKQAEADEFGPPPPGFE